MTKRVVILGSTGSVGINTLRIIENYRDRFQVVGLACGSNIEKLGEQIASFCPEAVSLGTDAAAQGVRDTLFSGFIGMGPEGHVALIERTKPDIVIAAMAGTYSLRACLRAIEMGVSTLGVANKEILVMAGDFVADALSRSPTQIIPVDSEHSAIFQCLMGNSQKFLRKIFLTGSGGPFRTRDRKTFGSIHKEEALKHPNWTMGAKITVDSATMMNKALEYIEALRLFSVSPSQIEVMIHPESLVHSMVEFCDGSVMAQLGPSDMRLPISLALAYPERIEVTLEKPFDLTAWHRLHFEKPDEDKFSALRLVREALQRGPQGPIVFNAANEVAVAQFLSDEISFLEIMETVEEALKTFEDFRVTDLTSVIELDAETKAWASRKNLTGRPKRFVRG